MCPVSQLEHLMALLIIFVVLFVEHGDDGKKKNMAGMLDVINKILNKKIKDTGEVIIYQFNIYRINIVIVVIRNRGMKICLRFINFLSSPF